MRFQQIFGRTLREAPAEAELVSHRLALRAGLVRSLSPASYTWLPLGWRVIRRLEALLQAEFDALGGQELHLPGDGGNSWGHVTALAALEIYSHRDLPRLLSGRAARQSSGGRVRAGLFHAHESTVLETFSLDRDPEGLEAVSAQMTTAIEQVLSASGIGGEWVEGFARDGAEGHSLMLPHDYGADHIANCDQCGYRADARTAAFRPAVGQLAPAAMMEKLATPDCKTIQAVADFVGVPTSQTLKAVFFIKDAAEFVFVVIRGDLEVSERKLLAALGGGTLRAATEAEILKTGAVPGYASPVGLNVRSENHDGVNVIVDRSVEQGANFVVGANDRGYHLIGVNYPRDFTATHMVDLAEAYEGASCVRCGQGALHVQPAFELAWNYVSPAIDATYLNEQGQPGMVALGWYGVRLERIMAAVIEAHHDDFGIIWPQAVAPFEVHIVTLGKESEYHERGRELYTALKRAGVATLLDDRDERPGVKFADADLIGVPLRLTVSKRALERGAVEAKWRHIDERFDISFSGAVSEIVSLVHAPK